MQSNQKAHDKLCLKHTKKPSFCGMCVCVCVCVCVHACIHVCVDVYITHMCQLCVLLQIYPCMCVCIHCIHVLCVCCLYTHFIHFISLPLHIHDTCQASTCLRMHFFILFLGMWRGPAKRSVWGRSWGVWGVNGGWGVLYCYGSQQSTGTFPFILFFSGTGCCQSCFTPTVTIISSG